VIEVLIDKISANGCWIENYRPGR